MATHDGASRIGVTPQEAATKSVGGTAIRTNQDGRFALVLVRGGSVEDSTGDVLILTEHFGFGWQSIIDLYYACDLQAYVRSQRARDVLLDGVHTTVDAHRDPGPCEQPGDGLDRGAASDIEAIRKHQVAAFVPSVVVAGDFALAERGGGQTLYRRRDGRWVGIAGGGGSMDVDDLASYGVPTPLRCTLIPYAGGCAPNR
jgi:hypothetical protein